MNENDSSYSLVVLTRVNPEKELPTDVFLKIDGRYMRFREKGDVIGAEKFESFMQKGLEGLYVRDEEVIIFLDWLSYIRDEEVQEVVESAGENTREIALKNAEVREKVYETFFGDELTDERIEILQEQVSDFVEKIRAQPFSQQTIGLLTKRNATIADHSMNVANLAVYIAMVLGHGHQYVLENVYLGAILHDLGKAKSGINESGFGDARLYSQAIQAHPEMSLKVIRKSKGVPDPVYKIILQHHEQWNGYGYPAGLEGDAIYEMAQVVSLANIFDNILYENRHLPREEGWSKAVKRIDLEKERFWNPKFFPRVLQALSKPL